MMPDQAYSRIPTMRTPPPISWSCCPWWAEAPEEIVPVVLAAAHQGQLFGTGVLHVDGDVPEVLGDPPQGHHGGVAITATPEVRHKDRGYEELHQGAAEEADELAEDAEHRMPEFVDGEVED